MSTETDGYGAARSGMGAVGVMVVAVLAFGTGLGVGGAAGWSMKEPEEKLVEVPRELNEEELNAACATRVQEASAQLDEANTKVVTLESQVTAKEQEVAQLEAMVASRQRLSDSQATQLQSAKVELESLKRQLGEARAEKEKLVAQLAETQVALDEQVVQTEKAKGDATTARWSAFAKDAQITICEKGNRKALGKCRETVQEKVRKHRVEFETCVRSGQAEPSLREADKGDELPEFAQWLDQDDKVTKGWYILLCDPSLPEAGGNAEGNPG